MARSFLPALRRSSKVARQVIEGKVVAPSAFSQYYASLSGFNHVQTRDWPIERAVAEGFDRVMWVFKSVNTISADSARLPFQLREGRDEDAPVVDDHPLYRVLNRKANPLETGQVFRKRLSAQVLLSKRGAFVEVTKSNGGSIIRCDLLPPDRVEIIPDLSGGVDHFRLNKRNGEVKNLDPSKVRWFRDPHPLDPYSGVTPLESAGQSVELDHMARMYNVTFMQNDGRPGGVLAVRDSKGTTTDLDPVQMNRIEDRFGKGPTEAGKLSVIAGELSYVDLATRPRDMQYNQTSRNAKIEILSAFGIGESVLGYAAERTFDNADNELYVYWTRTMPAHNEILLAGFDEDSEDDFHGFLDTSSIEILERAAKAKREEWRTEVAAGLRSLKSYADAAGYGDEIESTPHTRALYIPSGKTPLPSTAEDAEALGLGTPVDTGGGAPPGEGGEEGGAPAAPPAPGGEPGDTGTTDPSAPPQSGEPGGAAAAALRAVAGKGGLVAIEGGRPKARAVYRLSKKSTPGSGTVESTPDEDDVLALEADIAAALEVLVDRWIDQAMARIQAPKQRKHTRHWTPEYDHDTRVGTKALDSAYAANEATWRAEAEDAAHPILHAAAVATALALLIDVGITPPPGMTLAKMAAEAVAQSVAHVVGFVGRSAAKQAVALMAEINRSDQEGEDLDGIIGVIRDRTGRLVDWAHGLAIQTAGATVNGSRDDAAREANRDENIAVERAWISRRDEKVRHTHRLADGQVRGLDEPFIVGTSLLRFPQDPLGPPRETANCRCRLKHRCTRTGRWVAEPDRKALPRDGDGDGLVYDGTPLQRPALRPALGNEAAIATGAKHIAAYAPRARAYRGATLAEARTGSWSDMEDALWATFSGGFTTANGEEIHVRNLVVLANGQAEDTETGETVAMYEVTGAFTTPEGDYLGHFSREFAIGADEIRVMHTGMGMEAHAQGRGIGTEFLARSMAWYRRMGVDKVTLNASGSPKQRPRPGHVTPDGGTVSLDEALSAAARVSANGGYTWGQQGFDWAHDRAFESTLPGIVLRTVQDKQRLHQHGLDGGLDIVGMLRDWENLRPGHRGGLMVILGRLADVVPESWWDDPIQRQALIDFLTHTDQDAPPTPFEINSIGREAPFVDRETGEQTWLGKALMSRSSWTGQFLLAWLDLYPETKGRRTKARPRLLAGLFLAALGAGDETLVETKSVTEVAHNLGRIAANVEARADRWPRDGDSDGFIYDGTARMRPAPRRMGPLIRGSFGRPFSETQERERARRRQAAEPKPEAIPDPEWDQSYLIRPGDPMPWERQGAGVAENAARSLANSAANAILHAGGDPGMTDVLIRQAQAYDEAVKGEDQRAAAEALGRLLATLQRLLDLRTGGGKPILSSDDLGMGYTRLSNLSVTVKPDAKARYNDAVKRTLPRDADNDGFIYDGTPRQMAAPLKTPTYRVVYRGLDEGEAMVEARVDGEVVGALRWNYHEDPPVVVDMSVDEKYRRQGIGTRLFEEARKHESRLVHSDSLTDDGRAFAAATEPNRLEQVAHAATRAGAIAAGNPDPGPMTDRSRGRVDGTGTVDDPIDVQGDLDRAAALIAEGKHVRLNRVDEIGTLVSRLAEIVRTALERGDDVAVFDLCYVSVPGTNLFCQDSHGIPRIGMPQLSGKPLPGSPAWDLPRNERGNANVKPAFRAMLEARGISVEKREVATAWLKATQNEVDGPATGRIYDRIKEGLQTGSGSWATRDGYILDGHHQWAAQVAVDSEDNHIGDHKMTVDVIDLDIGEALELAHAFAKEQGIQPSGIGVHDTAGAPTPEPPAPDHVAGAAPDERPGPVRIENVFPVAGFNHVYEGVVAAGTPPVWRHIGDRRELQGPAEAGWDEWDAHHGGFTVRAMEGDTQFATDRDEVMKWEHPLRRSSAGYHILVQADVSGLDARFIGRTEPFNMRSDGNDAPNFVLDGDEGTLYPTTGLGLGILGPIPVERIRSIELFSPQAVGSRVGAYDVTQRFESFADYATWVNRSAYFGSHADYLRWVAAGRPRKADGTPDTDDFANGR